jgi:hypothetical protein
VTKIMEPLARESGISKDRLEPTSNGDPVHWCSDGRREREAARVIVPARAGKQPLGALTDPVRPKGITDQRREGDHPAAGGGLRLDQDESPVDPLECMADGQCRRVQVDVAPGETKDLALAEADAEGDQVERFEPVTPDRLEETPSFLR